MSVWGGMNKQNVAHVHKMECCCLVTKSCLTLCNRMDCSPPGSSVHVVSQARILKWIAVSFSRGSSPLRDCTLISCIGRRILYHWATREAHMYKKWNVVYKKRMLFSIKKEGNSYTSYNMDEPWGHYAKWNKTCTERQILCDSPFMRYLEESVIETESRTVAVRAWGRESRELLLNGYRVSALQHDKDSRDWL